MVIGLKKLLFFTNLLRQLIIGQYLMGQFVIGQFVIGQLVIGQFNKPITFKVAV